MHSQRTRAREQFASVLLAVLGVIQALALELLWEQGIGGIDRWRDAGAALAGWLQIASVFQGVVVVWTVYATLVLRFSWVPRFRDLVFPFLVGALEFGLVALMQPDRLASWFALLGVIFATMSSISFATFAAIYREGGHERDPWDREQLMSYVPSVAAAASLLGFALGAWLFGATSWVAFIGILTANLGLAFQLSVLRRFWHADVAGTREE